MPSALRPVHRTICQALEVNWLLRKAAQASDQELIIAEEEGVWAIQTSTVLKTIRKEFKVSP